MSWKKHFRVADTSPLTSVSPSGSADMKFSNYASQLPEVYVGHPNRTERYTQYENMDVDSEVNAALDILSEFCTQTNVENGTVFDIHWNELPSDSEVETITEQLINWNHLNEFNKRAFKMFRNVLKYGDQVFIRDPETFEWFWTDMNNVIKVIVNESEGKKPEQYVVKDLNPNFQNLTATQRTYQDDYHKPGTRNQGYIQPSNVYTSQSSIAGGRFNQAINETAVEASHIVHLSLTEGLDVNWPFGNSILENIFKVYKQKELLEDAIIIYRIQRAPERRVFYVDVGNMPSHMAMAFVERVKNEIHQRRIPSQTGGGANILDTTYNPLCLDLATKIPLLDGRTLELSEIIEEFNNGKENWAYSCNPDTGKVVPGVINWAGATRKNTSVLQLTFDNGKTLICTPDHKIPVFGKGFVEAKDLTVDDSLIAFNVKNEKISDNSNDYQQVWDHELKKWVWTHRMVGEFFRKLSKHQEYTYLEENIGKEKTVIHHKDYNRFNNDPRNLTYMNKKDHILYHASQKADFWKTMTDEYRIEMTSKITNTLKETWKNLTEDERASKLWQIRSAQKKAVWLRQNDPKTMESYAINARASRLAAFVRDPQLLAQCKQNMERRVKIKNQPLVLTFDMLQIVADIVKAGKKNKQQVLALCDKNQKLLNLVKNANTIPLDYKNAHCKIDFDRFGYSKMDRLLTQYGYQNWKHFVKEIENFNHRITSIELVENRDTGTITIDGTEKWQNYHTFATDSGIFVKNSINEDYFFPQTCLSLDTKIPLLSGQTKTLENLIDDHKNGVKNWVYGLDKNTHELEPAEIKWAGVTRKNAEVLRITIDNGESVTVTPDHRFIMRDGSEVEAQDLKPGYSVMPLELLDGYSGPKQKNKKYTRYRSNADGKVKFVHATIANKHPGKDTQVHHVDFNSKNNNPDNLQVMKTEEHIQLHRETGTYSLSKQWNNSDARQKLINGIHALYANANDDFRQKITERNRMNAHVGWQTMTDDAKDSVLSSLAAQRAKTTARKRILYSIDMFTAMKKCFDEGHNSISKLSKGLRQDTEFQRAFCVANPNILRERSKSKNLQVTDATLNNLVNIVGFKTFGDWKVDHTGCNKYGKTIRQNHKIVTVEWLEERIDTGDITIESRSDSHWFGLAAGIYVHNSEGRGSKVETLPGGTNLGEIDDLRYFTNKLFRGLRIPSSYLPTGSDEAPGAYADGRVGTALIQEFRFNEYCKRLQRLVVEVFDREFKMFLKWRGLELDNSSFELRFNEPQNFSKYRETELDSSRISTFTQLEQYTYMSKRFLMKRFLGLSEEEMTENERLWQEENADDVQSDLPSLRSVGVTPGGLERDLETFDTGDLGAEDLGGEDLGSDPTPPPTDPPTV